MTVSSMLIATIFIAAIIVIACAGLAGLYLLCRHSHGDKPARKSLPMSNLK